MNTPDASEWMDKNEERLEWNRGTIEKLLQSWLRHKPEKAGLQLSPEGWIGLSELVIAFQRQGYDIGTDTLANIVRYDHKSRFEMEGDRIRARYGYSIEFESKPHPGMPPATLYHAAPARFAQRILENGLKPVKRQFIHLSPERKEAVEVSGHGKQPPLLLKIAAHEAHAAGVLFYPRGKAIWLSEAIPAEFVTLYEPPEQPMTKSGDESHPSRARNPELRSRKKGHGFLKKPRPEKG